MKGWAERAARIIQTTFMSLSSSTARFYPTLAHSATSPPAIASPPSVTDGTVIDADAALNSLSARAAPGPEGGSMPSSPFLSTTPGLKRMTQAPLVMGRFDHPVPPMPSVRCLARSMPCRRRRRLIERLGIIDISEKPFSLESISYLVMQSL
jgi:hypothetical protein